MMNNNCGKVSNKESRNALKESITLIQKIEKSDGLLANLSCKKIFPYQLFTNEDD